ncbi:hypothetical protein BC830DRAFT_366924 [Chytriomyces sp. MP71]|nr:hypothetical protein BC830DRAFT_366924 [Chytriomyces sp. MP71]
MDGGPRFTLPTRPSRLLRVPSPPVVHDEAPTQIRPYPHSTKRSNAYTQQPQLDGGLENTLKTKDEAALEAAGRRSPQRQAICQIESAGGNKSISEKTKRKVLPHVDSASTLAENQEDVTAIGSKMPILKTAGADVTNAKRGKSVKGIGPLDTRVSSSSTLNDESDLDRPPVTKQFRQFASDIDSEDEKEGGGEDDTDDGAEEDEGLVSRSTKMLFITSITLPYISMTMKRNRK